MWWRISVLALLCVLQSTPLHAQEKQVTLTTLEWPPYISQSLPKRGYVHELVEAAFRRSGYRVEVQFLPWSRALLMAQSGEVDGVFPEYFSEQRLADFIYSDPFLGGPVGFYKRKDSAIDYSVDPRLSELTALHGLAEYRIGVVRDYLNTDLFDQAHFLKKEEASSDLLNLKKLHFKRLDLAFVDKFVAEYLLATQLPEYQAELEFLHPPLEIKYLYVAFSKKAPEHAAKVAAFNAGLQALKDDGSLSDIYHRHGFREALVYEQQFQDIRTGSTTPPVTEQPIQR